MNILCLIIGMILLVIGGAFYFGYGLNWISGWRSLSNEEKEQINTALLEKNVAVLFVLLAIVFISAGVSPLFLEKAFTWCTLLWMLITLIDARWISKSPRLYKDFRSNSKHLLGGKNE